MTQLISYPTKPGEEMGTDEHMDHIRKKYRIDQAGVEKSISKTMEILSIDRRNAIMYLLEIKMPIDKTDFTASEVESQ